MFRIDHATAAATLPAPLAAGTPGYYAHSDPVAGIPPTIVTPDWANGIQEELMSILAAAGIAESKGTNNQVLTALEEIFAAPPAASTTQVGVVRLATIAEAEAGTETTTAVTPADLATVVDAAVAAEAGTRANGDTAVEEGVQAGAYLYGADTSGAANTVTLTLAPAPTAYAAGMSVRVKIANNNTGASTININGLGAKTILWSQRALIGGELLAGYVVELVYDGANFQIHGLTAITGTNSNGRYRVSQDGFIEQWITYGSAISTEGPITVNYPISFVTTALIPLGIINNSSSQLLDVTTIQVVGAPGLSSVTVFIQDHSTSFADAAGGFVLKVEGY